MAKYFVHFEHEETEAEFGGVVSAEIERGGYPWVYEEDDGRFIVPRDSHVRIYEGRNLKGIYCGHSRAIEPRGIERGFELRYKDGEIETYCPHSQSWEPVQ